MSTQMPVLKEPARKRRGNKKLLAILLLLFIALLAVLFFNSSISKVSDIQITGNTFTTRDQIVQSAGIHIGDAFFQTSSSSIASKVEKQPQVESVDVMKVFPGIVKITVKEFPVVAFELAEQGELTALLANGTSVKSVNSGNQLLDKPILSGWKSDDPVKLALTKQLALIPVKQLSDLSEITPIPSKAYPDRIRMYTRTRFEVITAVSVLPDKIEALNAVIETQEPGKITMLLADTYVPFSIEDGENIQSD
ncbi:FtsQ-type POTRA domain-containing protein [Paenibacillus sp. GSMTC-2017]|uniref:cell division protein FtsQ/DivIB n=1 Tax=Paenibacillus sp. GSMTC-2017 TaxID=2794350 RepID=UPI0018D938B3|nr:FtsQ-type POTRA domain-containing protein [Paenibacillus sp. GSMTC-2017]MBH5316897.1 FtsQ-type POTRA domain-containing protein [Paenibacillus sp. GSMTC-2017]